MCTVAACLRRLSVVGLFVAAVAAAVADRPPVSPLVVPVDPPVFGYRTVPAFGSLRFTDPVAIATPPGETNRLFVAEQGGRLAVITNLAAPTRSVFLDLSRTIAGGRPNDERGLLGVAFHPGYATNGAFFVFYSTTTNGVLHQRLSRFRVREDDPHRADAASERILLSQRDDAGNHNGGDLHFGPDGYLYVAVGDEGGANDAWNNSQVLDRDFFAGILRIDVDLRPGSLAPNPHPAVFPGAYAVPPDNPWVGATTFNGRPVNPAAVRTEFWAVGLRNPWRMSFDPATGQLWLGDVGQNAREEINVIRRGGNYGWAFREGTLAGPKAAQAPPGAVFDPPVVQYARGQGPQQGNSVTGGVVYRGLRLSQLTGAYVFSDYVSGNVWAIRWNGTQTPPMERLTRAVGIAGFGRDPRQGDVLLADQTGDQLLRLDYTAEATGTPLPPTLAETGAFTDLATLTPAAGVVPYAINVPFWSDGAAKARWFAIPDPNRFFGFRSDDPWDLPEGAVWVKHFEIERIRGVPESVRRLETRFLVRNASGMHGFTYRWTDPPTNAVLVAEEGMEEVLEITEEGVPRPQVWRYPGRAECLQCHTPAGGWALGFNTRQLHREIATEGGSVGQLQALEAAGYLQGLPASGLHHLPVLAPADDARFSVEWRVRSWLDANCSHCHQPGGTAFGGWDARARAPLSQSALIRGNLRDDLGNPENRVVVPGSVELTMLHNRIVRLDALRMPPLASRVIDDAAVALLRQWIANDLPSWRSYEQWQATMFPSPQPGDFSPEADPDGDDASNWLEYLTGTDPMNPESAWALEVGREGEDMVVRYPRLANRGFVVEWTDRVTDADSWRPLESEANRFRIPPATEDFELREPVAAGERFYRVRVFEP